MRETRIVALAMGSTYLTAVVGKRLADGTIAVEATASADGTPFIHKGVVSNIDEMAQAITDLKNQIEEKLQVNITHAYIGVSGLSLHSQKNVINHHLGKEEKIGQTDVDTILDQNHATRYEGYEILDSITQEFVVNRVATLQPVGMISEHIEGRFLNLIQSSSYLRRLDYALEQANLLSFDYVIAPLATASLLLTDEERQRGCALVDIGASTTTVAVYHDATLRHLAVLPLGSNAVNRDLATLALLSDAEAESVKRELPAEEPFDATPRKHYEIASARMEEILANVMNQIDLSGYHLKLTAGIVLTGGGAQIECLKTLFSTNYPNEKYRFALLPSCQGEIANLAAQQAGQLLGLLAMGTMECTEPKYTVPKTSLFDDLFGSEPAVEPETPAEQQPAERPAEVIEPIEPTVVDEPKESKEPAEPEKPAEPVEPEKPAEPAKPVEPAKPTKPGKTKKIFGSLFDMVDNIFSDDKPI